MSMVCELTGKSVLFGNTVSHSERKARRKYAPNLQNVTFLSDVLKQKIRFKVSTRGIKTVEVHGGIDDYLVRTKDILLSKKAKKFKKIISNKAS